MVTQGLQHSGQLQTDSSHILQFVNLVKYRMCRCQLPEFWEDEPAGWEFWELKCTCLKEDKVGKHWCVHATSQVST